MSSTPSPSFTHPPPTTPSQGSPLLSFPSPYILLVTLNRPSQMNSIPFVLHWHLDRVFKWFDSEPSLRVAVITGSGKKAFCAGQDLIELGSRSAETMASEPWVGGHPTSGFGGISRRVGKKPIVAAVNGWALGGGFEIVLNCDMVVASPNAQFGLPEALRGIYASAGGLPRLIRNVGLPMASEIALTGRFLSAEEALRYNLVNKISKSQDTVVQEAIDLATKCANISPDSIIVTRAALKEAWQTASVDHAREVVDERYSKGLRDGENTREGLSAFAQKRKPNWVASKL